jgi:peptidoglycan/xylan/chitin deacetylase (PgdA/CDA1 family)
VIHAPICLTGDIDDGLEDFQTCIRPLAEMLGSCDIRMTIPVTAVALKQRARNIAFLADRDHEIAGHGDVHEPFLGPVEAQIARLQRMKEEFRIRLGFTPVGFRAPYLSHDLNLYRALSHEGFRYDSSQLSRDPLLYLRYAFSPRPMVFRRSFRELPRILAQHVSGKSVPRARTVAPGVLELPVFELDDWFFLESPRGPRLRDDEVEHVARVWTMAATDFGHSCGIFVLQAHPKRVSPKLLRILETFISSFQSERIPFMTLRQASRQLENATSSVSDDSARDSHLG